MAINLIKINEFPESIDTKNWMVVADSNGVSYKISIDNVKAELGIGALMQYRGSVVPTSPVQPAGDFFVTATQDGTYTNYGGVVIPANSFGVISRVGGVYTSSITGLNTNAVLKTDIVNDLTEGGADKVLSAEMGKLLNYGTLDTVIYAPVDPFSSYNGLTSTNSTRILNTPMINGKLKEVKVNATRAGSGFRLAIYSKNIDGTFNFKSATGSSQITLTLGLNVLTPSEFGDIDVIDGDYLAFFNSATGGYVGFKSSAEQTYVYGTGNGFPTGTNITFTSQTTASPGIEITLSSETEMYKLLTSGIIKTGNTFNRSFEVSNVYLDTDFSGLIINKNGYQSDSLGREKYAERVGLNTSWQFKGSLVLDEVSKTAALTAVLNSETYDSSGYSIDTGAASGEVPALVMDADYSLNSLNYSKEVLEFTVNRLASGSLIGTVYFGQTLYSRKLGHSARYIQLATAENSTFANIKTTSIPTNPWAAESSSVVSEPIVNTGDYRIEHEYNGQSHFSRIYKKADGLFILIGSTVHSYGSCEDRPSNRKYGILLNNIGVKITRYDTYSYEPYRTRLLFIGDSIQSGFSCTDFNNAYSRIGTRFNGIAGSVRSGHGCTTDDFLPMMPEILQRKPEKVVLALGLNDVRYGIAGYQAKYISIVDQLEAIGTEVVLCKLIPNNVDDVRPFNTWQQTMFPNNEIVDFYTPMEDPANPNKLNPLYHTDGTHPNDLGNAIMFNVLKPYL